MNKISVRFDDADYEAIQKLASENGLPLAEIVRSRIDLSKTDQGDTAGMFGVPVCPDHGTRMTYREVRRDFVCLSAYCHNHVKFDKRKVDRGSVLELVRKAS